MRPVHNAKEAIKSIELVPNWWRVIRYGWNIRLTIIAAILYGIEFLLPYIPQIYPVPIGLFGGFGFVITVLAGIARIIVQPKVSGGT